MFSKETKIILLQHRRNLLASRDASVNRNILRKIDRQLRKHLG